MKMSLRPCTTCSLPSQMHARQNVCGRCRAFDSAESIHRQAVHRLVTRALKTGQIVREPCVACAMTGLEQNGVSHGHHEDYSKPLDIVWLCPMHHRRTHLRGLEYVMCSRIAA